MKVPKPGPFVAVVLAMISIQFGASLAKHLFIELGPLGVTAFRTGFAAGLLWLIWKPWRKDWGSLRKPAVILYGASLGLMNLLFYLSLARIPLGLAVTLEFIGPLGYSVFSSRRRMDFLWILLAAFGVWLILPSHKENALDISGVLLALAAGVGWGFYIYFGQRTGSHSHGGFVTSVGMLVAALVSSPFYFLNPSALASFHRSALPMAFAVAVLCSALPYSLEMIALRSLPAKTFGILMSLEPAVAALSGFLFLREHLGPWQWLAIFLVISASAGSAWTGRQRAADAP